MSLKLTDLRTISKVLLEQTGLSTTRAEQTTDALLFADVWGVASHGVLRLPWYLERAEHGGISPEANLTAVADHAAVVTLDGQAGYGHWQAWQAAEEAARRAVDTGVAVVSVSNSNHCGALGVHTLPMLRRNLIGLAFSNGPAVMPPWGGEAPLFSTSPLAAGIPSSPAPIVIDMALSTVARGKVFQRASEGRLLPTGWALDSDGKPTTDPDRGLAGMLSPLGGAKGYALALLVESLTGGLVGPRLSGDVVDMFDREALHLPQGISHLVMALNPDLIDPSGDASQRFDDLTRRISLAGGRQPGSTRVVTLEGMEAEQVPIQRSTLVELADWATRSGTHVPEELASALG